MSNRRKNIGLSVAALCFTALWFALLGGRSLYEPDEGRYAEIPREMLSGGDWVIPHLNGLVYLEKPPLQYWITALAYAGLGHAEGTARLWTGLAGYLSLAAVFFTACRLWGPDAGIKAFLLTSASWLFVLLGHQLTLDMSLCFFLTSSLACFLTAQSNRGQPRRSAAWMALCWAAMALAVLTKGLIGVLIPAATLVLYSLVQRDAELWKRLNMRWGLPLFALIAVPWFVLAARANPAFLRFFFVREHLQRFLTPIEHRSEPWWFFLPVLGVGILPWLPQVLRSLVSPWQTALPRGEFDPRRVLWIWCAFVLVFFSCSDAKLIPYILPLVPALALLCASPSSGEGRGELLAGALLSLASSVGILAYASTIWSSADGLALAVTLRPVILYSALLLALAAACVLCLMWRWPRSALAAQCIGWFLAACTILAAAHAAQGFYSAKNLALVLRAIASAGAPVYAVQCYDQSLPFYLGHPVILVAYQDEFALGLGQDPRRGIATLREFSDRWSSSNEAYAVMPLETHGKLSADGLPMRALARFKDQLLVSRR